MPSSNPAFSRGFPGAPNGPGAQFGNQGYAQPGPQQYGAPSSGVSRPRSSRRTSRTRTRPPASST